MADRLTVSGAAGPLIGMAAQGAAQKMVRQAVQQAKAAVEPVIERNPDVFDHLAAAGSELLAAYRSAIFTQERRWTAGPDQREDDHGAGAQEHDPADSGPTDRADRPSPQDPSGDGTGDDRPGEGLGPGEHIDLD